MSKPPFISKGLLYNWDNERKQLVLQADLKIFRREKSTRESVLSSVLSDFKSNVRLRDTIDKFRMVQFRKHFQRRVPVTEPDVVTIQDIRDVAIYSTYPEDLTTEFIGYFHSKAVDIFLRSLIIYFEYYFQVWEHLMKRRIEALHKIDNFHARISQDKISASLSELRCVVARNYGILLLGRGASNLFHHINPKNGLSMSDADRRFYETFLSMIIRSVWIAHNRRYYDLIEREIYRMFCSDAFNRTGKVFRRGLEITRAEKRTLYGQACRDESKLMHRSPGVQELLYGQQDFMLMSIGILDLSATDDKAEFFKKIYDLPEEDFVDNGISVGILGWPRNCLDPMLKEERNKEKKLTMLPIPKLPKFQIPPKPTVPIANIDWVNPKPIWRKPERTRVVEARNRQCLRWKKYLTSQTKRSTIIVT